jgi:O-antigen/teichoic acid export membrane protein
VKPPVAWHREDRRLLMFTRNMGMRYFAIAVHAAIGLVLVPFNLAYLGPAAYGLWILTASITAYFSVLELGYGSATVKYVAEYRAKRNARALNEIASTTFYLFSALGIASYLLAVVVALFLPRLFDLDAEAGRTGQIILLIIAANVALHFAFSVFGGVINGFERSYKNTLYGTGGNVAAAVANVAVLLLGFGLVELVAATTVCRMLPYWFFRRNAYLVFPELSIRLAHVRRERFRELTGFSVYLAIIDWSSRLMYTTSAIIIGAILSTAAVAVYSIAQRLTDEIVKITNQLHAQLFPALVHRNEYVTLDEQRQFLVRTARFQLACAVALACTTAAAAGRLLPAWVGPGFEQSVPVLQLLAVVVVLRASMAMPTTLLKATGHHRYVAVASAWCAVASVLLSITLVRTIGLIGVAWGTLLPVAVLAAAVIFPRTCRVLSLPRMRALRLIVWPALWPAVPVMAALVAARDLVPPRLVFVLPFVGIGALAYGAIFLRYGLDHEEREWMWSRLRSLRRGRPQELAAA